VVARASTLSFVVILLGVFAHAQTPSLPQGAPRPGAPPPRVQGPVRDNSATATPTGTARIHGRVVSADTGAPLRRATIRISSAELRVNRSVNTDAEGRYDLSELAAGRYNIYVTRNGYVSLQFGQRRPFESGRPLELADGQTAEKIDFALPRGGVIAGRVTDELGEPLAGIRMQAMRHSYMPNGQRQLVPVNAGPFGVVSNDLGEFRLYGLMPGTYIVSASPSDVMVMMPGAGAAAADYEGHGTTYYPGTLNSEEAQAIAVGLAEEAPASFALVTAKMTKISGMVRSSTGKPVTNVMLTIRTRAGMGFGMRSGPGLGPDGSFSIGNVPPGDHWLEVIRRSGIPDSEGASVPITADGSDIDGLVVTTSPGATISGQVVFDGASQQKPGRVVVTSSDPFGASPVRMFDNNQGTIDQNGRFELKGVFGRVLFAVGPAGFGAPPIGWSVKSVMLNGVNIIETPLETSSVASITGVEIVLTDKQTTVAGNVRTTTGLVTDYTVAIFPETPREPGVNARYVRIARPDQQGRFETKGLPPGDYFAVAVESLEQGGQWDPAFRKQVEPTAKRFRLIEGQTTTIELPLTQ
jgi:hypothetical protein